MAFQQYQSTELLQSHRKHLKGQKQAVDKLGAEREKIKELKEQKELDLEQMASREDYLEKKKEKLLAQKKQEEDRLRRELQVQEEQLQRKRRRQPSPPPSLSSAYHEQGFGYFQPQHGEGGAAAATTAADFFSLSDISRIEPRRARATNDQTPGRSRLNGQNHYLNVFVLIVRPLEESSGHSQHPQAGRLRQDLREWLLGLQGPGGSRQEEILGPV